MKKNILWIILFIYLILSFIFLSPEKLNFSLVQILFWIGFITFTGFTMYCTKRENFFKSLKKISGFHWGWQIGIDLYIGLFIQAYIIFLTEGSIPLTLLWLLPMLIYGNIITLYYYALKSHLILTHFL